MYGCLNPHNGISRIFSPWGCCTIAISSPGLGGLLRSRLSRSCVRCTGSQSASDGGCPSTLLLRGLEAERLIHHSGSKVTHVGCEPFCLARDPYIFSKMRTYVFSLFHGGGHYKHHNSGTCSPWVSPETSIVTRSSCSSSATLSRSTST